MKHRCFQDMRYFVTSVSILLFVDITAGVYFRSALTTIERRFELSATKVALLSSAFQIGNLAVMAFVSYYGSRTHRPRFIAAGSILVALGYLIACLPQFFGGRYEYVDTVTSSSASTSKQVEMCDAFSSATILPNITTCENAETRSGNNLYILIVAGMILAGIGAAPLQPLGISYIDDHSDPRKSPLYVGIVMTVALIGPAAGFLLGAALLRIWVDYGWIDISKVKILPTNPSWVGAWWLGFLLTGVLVAIAAIPVCFFPKKMKRRESKKAVSEYHIENKAEKIVHEDFEGSMEGVMGFFRTLKRLFTNTTYLVIILMWVCSSYNIAGIVTFFPKYLEVQFGLSASKANMFYGAIGIPCLAVGTLLGSFLMKRLNPDRYGMIKILLSSRLISTLISITFLFLGCETIDIAGITKPYTDSVDSNALNPLSSCNTGCDCANGTFTPVCGADGLTYLSPCHAGCKGVYSEIQGITQNYTDCSCINPESSNADDQSNWSYPERCLKSKCGHLVVLVLATKALSSLVGGIGATPSYVFLMRSVGQKEKAFAIGVIFMVTRLLGWIPAPVIYGKVIDTTCIYWATNPCGGRGYCRIYDSNAYRNAFYSIALIGEFISCAFTFLLFLITRRQKHSGSDSYDYVAVKEKESHIVMRGPKKSIKIADAHGIKAETEDADVNGNDGGLTTKERFAST